LTTGIYNSESHIRLLNQHVIRHNNQKITQGSAKNPRQNNIIEWEKEVSVKQSCFI